MKKYGLIAIIVAALDQIVKAYVRSFPLGESIWEIPGILSFTHCVNTGAAFSVMAGYTAAIAVFSIGLFAGIGVYVICKLHLTMMAWMAVAFLAGGGIGNLMDRLLFSGVTDYIRLQFIDFPVFNLADIAITGSISVLLFLLVSDALEIPTEDKHGSDR